MASDETKMDVTDINEADNNEAAGDNTAENTKILTECTKDNDKTNVSNNGQTCPETSDNTEEQSKDIPEGSDFPPDSTESKTESSGPIEESSAEPEYQKETVDFKIIYNKKKHDITFPLDDTVVSLKTEIEKLTSVPPAMQKIMFKGKMRDDATLREQKVTKGSKMMVVGSTVTDVMSVSAPDPKTLKEEEKAAAVASKENYSKQKPHKTVLERYGKPDDVMPGKKGVKEPLPSVPVSGMYNKSGGKVRLTFKMENDQLWIGTKERTEKLPMGSVKAVVSEAIDGHEDYHLMGIQLGPTEASRYWVYWVPAQYVDSIKDAILGKFQYF